MKKWGNFIAQLFAICAFMATQALAAEAGAWKTPRGRVEAAERTHSAGVKDEMASRAVVEFANGISMRLLHDLVEKMLGIDRSSGLTVTLDTERIVVSFLVEF